MQQFDKEFWYCGKFRKFLFENNLHVMSNSNEISVLYYTHSVFMCKL